MSKGWNYVKINDTGKTSMMDIVNTNKLCSDVLDN